MPADMVCSECGHTYPWEDGPTCPNCGWDNTIQYEEKYNES